MIEISQSVELFTVLKNVTYHLYQKKNLPIDTTMCKRFKDVT